MASDDAGSSYPTCDRAAGRNSTDNRTEEFCINGEVYNEGKDFPMITNPGLAATAVTLESGEYFVLGDNRNNSEDSRYADIGMVRKRYIVGKIWFTCSPFEKLGFTKG